jgi:hypothetical protein
MDNILDRSFFNIAEEILGLDTTVPSKGYKLNEQGQEAINEYRNIIQKLEKAVIPVIGPYVTDVETLKKEVALQILSTINSHNIASEKLDIMSRLDTLTNGGQTIIEPNRFIFNRDDKILQYLTTL